MFKTNSKKLSKGQGLVEYALILVLVAVVVIAVLLILGPTIGNVFTKVNNSLLTANGGGGAGGAGGGNQGTPEPTVDPYPAWQASMRNKCNADYASYPSKGVDFQDHGATVSAVCIYGDGFNTPSMTTIGTYTKP